VAQQHFNTEVAVMQAGAGHVREVNALIDTDLKSLLSKLEALFGTWQGTASASFHQLKDQWVINEQKLNTALMGISDTLEVNSRNYDTTEQAATADFNSAAGGLG
jgi:WXG100 family type VII secretion target